MKTLFSILQKAQKECWAVPHFNVSDLDQMRGVCEAAAKLKSPLMIGVSEGERAFIGLRQVVALVAAFREEFGIPIFLNADHTKSVRPAKAAIDAGFDSIHIDLSKKSWKENVTDTKKVAQYAKKKNPLINVEGELGYLMTESSKMYTKKITIDPESLTKPEEAARYVKMTGVHRFAPAVGNLHGIAANRPKLDYARIKKIRALVPARVALVLHGGSGNSPLAFKKAIRAGITNIHISTQLRLADTRALKESIHKNPNETTPYKLSEKSLEAVRKTAEQYIKIFGSTNKT